MIKAMRLNDQGLKPIELLYDPKMLRFLIGDTYALMPLSGDIGALMKLRPYVGEHSWGKLQKHDDTWDAAWGTILFVKYDEGKPVSLTEEDYFVIRARVDITKEEPESYATG